MDALQIHEQGGRNGQIPAETIVLNDLTESTDLW
jgi:hypothetical protein